MALQGPVAATATAFDDLDDDFAGFSDHEEDTEQDTHTSEGLPIREAQYHQFTPKPTVELLQLDFNEWAQQQGFAVVRKHGRNRQDRELSRYDFLCDRYGNPRPSRSVSLRKTGSRKYSCKFRYTAARTTEGWILHRHTDKASHIHNHHQSLHPSSHPQHRKLSEETRQAIADLSKHNAIRPREIRTIINNRDPTSVLIRKDVYNARNKIRKDEL